VRNLILLFLVGSCLSGCFSYQVRTGELGQNWNEEDQRIFYQTSQGSQLLKYDWFLALEQASSEKLFLNDSLKRFGYLPDPFAASQSEDDSHLLPIGFVKDVGIGYIGKNEVEGPWIGMTCAACHTAEIDIDGKSHLIDGAPTNADFYAFISELSESLEATVNDSEKFSRFAKNVSDDGSLQAELEQKAGDFSAYVQQSTPAEEWGKARLDAVGLILNTVAHRLVPTVDGSNQNAKERSEDLVHLDRRNAVRPRNDNTHQPNAPVSYPFLWDTFQQPHNQWNGVSVGTLSRNTTEVLGVFATFDSVKPQNNSVKFGGLKKLQGLVTNLRSPKWDDPKYDLPPINTERAARGKGLYKTHCESCHDVFDRDENQVKKVEIVLNGFERQGPGEAGFERPMPEGRAEVSIGTDPTMARNFVDNTFAEKQGEQLVYADDLIGTALGKVWLKSIFGALIYGGVEEFFNGKINRETEDLEVYKARPLNGVWATAPYLHNGSIPNIVELLKPANKRVSIFCVGSRKFDSKTLGFESQKGVDKNCGDNFKFDTKIAGNHNTGHDSYGLLEEEEIWAIIEFIKME
jgi:hypothetical protein